MHSKYISELRKLLNGVVKLIDELKLDNNYVTKVWLEVNKLKKESKESLSVNTLKETRYNKGVYIGSSGSNCRKIRYPKLKRSKRTWKKFYEMFPNAQKRIKV